MNHNWNRICQKTCFNILRGSCLKRTVIANVGFKVLRDVETQVLRQSCDLVVIPVINTCLEEFMNEDFY